SITLKGTYNNTDFTYDLEEFLEACLAPSNSMISVHNTVIEHFQNNNRFLDGLPLFIIRRHGSRAGEQGSLMRRRGWIVRFDNAYIVYADNFFPGHFFEAGYYISNFGISDL